MVFIFSLTVATMTEIFRAAVENMTGLGFLSVEHLHSGGTGKGRGAASQLLSRGRREQLHSGVGHAGEDEQLALAAGWHSHRRAGHT